MKYPKVSVIIPVFNTEEYLGYAIESIISQTLTDIEIIIINDGSTDNSLAILNDIAKTDNRIQLYNQENQGQSIARNNGIKKAKGEFIYFMDSDDALDKNALEACYIQCTKNNLDFVFFDGEILNKEDSFKLRLQYNRNKGIDTNKEYSGIEVFKIQLNNWTYSASPCLNFIRRVFLKDAKLEFFPSIIHEDELFTSTLYLKAQKVMYISKAFFKRRLREGSTMTNKITWKNIHGYITVSEELIKLRERGYKKEEDTINLFIRRMLNAAISNAHSMTFQDKIKTLLCCPLNLRSYISIKSFIIMLLK